MPRPLQLQVERLEDRVTPSTAWISPRRLTLSFVPDGTFVSSAASNLFQTLNSQLPAGDWRLEILRAVQTWAVNANVNVGLVADGGQPLGAGGLVQGDPRFGDIRIAAQPTTPDVVAAGTPFLLDGSTWSGDIVLNSNYRFGTGAQGTYDLFSVLLHEVGHALGLGESADPASAMFQNYAGARTGLSTQDVADLQALYGLRPPDAFDAKHSNDTLADATPLSANTGSVLADISTLHDVDCYRITVTDAVAKGKPLNFRVRTSGISLLLPSLTVSDHKGRVVGSANASDPLNGDLTVSVDGARAGNTFYVRVGNATQSVFGIGAYQLEVDQNSGNAATSPQEVFFNADNRKNNTLTTATKLTPRNSGGTSLSYSYQAGIDVPGDVDFYKVRSPKGTAAPQELIAVVSAANANGLAPRVDVYDADGKPVAARVIGSDQDFFSVQVLGARSDANYYIRVSSQAAAGTGNYFLGINFSPTQTVDVRACAAGVLTPTNWMQGQTLSVSRATAVDFLLSASTAGGSAQVEMFIRDGSGNCVFSLAACAGQPARSGVAFLGAGKYEVVYAALSGNEATTVPVSYSLQEILLSDPIGPQLVDGGTTSPSTSDPLAWSDPSTLALALLYGYCELY